jgi:hypothetical protein
LNCSTAEKSTPWIRRFCRRLASSQSNRMFQARPRAYDTLDAIRGQLLCHNKKMMYEDEASSGGDNKN